MANEQKTKVQIICDAVCGIIMLLSIVIYLIIGFVTNIWHPSWISIVVGAVLSGIISIVANSISDIKKLDAKQNSNEK